MPIERVAKRTAAPPGREVEFPSQGIVLRGRLYEQPGMSESPAVVMAHGFSATIDAMVADCYAKAFQAAGLTVLLYDHAHLGRSDGEPRQLVSVWRQARGYIDALSFVTAQPGVSVGRVALWGDSLSAGEAIMVAAVDPRVAAVVLQVPSLGRSAPPGDVDPTAYITKARQMLALDFNTLAFAPFVERPVVSPDQINAPSWLEPLTAFRWFMQYGGQFGTNWQNRASRSEPVIAPPYYPPLAAAGLRMPVFFVIARHDEMPGSRPDVAFMTYEQTPGPKKLLEIDGGHFGLLYHDSPIFAQVSSAEAAFLVEHLS